MICLKCVAMVPLVMGVDSNAHSTWWGEDSTISHGKIVEKWLMEHNLFLMNTGSTPTFVPLNDSRATIIDLTLINEWALNRIMEWRVDVRTT